MNYNVKVLGTMRTNTNRFTTRDHSCTIYWSSSENHWQTLQLGCEAEPKGEPTSVQFKLPWSGLLCLSQCFLKSPYLLHKAFNILGPSYIDTFYRTGHSCKLYYFKAFNPHAKNHLSTDHINTEGENLSVPLILTESLSSYSVSFISDHTS